MEVNDKTIGEIARQLGISGGAGLPINGRPKVMQSWSGN